MKKISLLLICLFLTSCYINGYCDVSEWKQREAQSMYNDFGTSIAEMDRGKMEKIFGACYRVGDQVYSYNTLWNKKYILVRYDKAVTYIEDNSDIVKSTVNDKYKNYNRGGIGVPQNQMSPGKNVQWF